MNEQLIGYNSLTFFALCAASSSCWESLLPAENEISSSRRRFFATRRLSLGSHARFHVTDSSKNFWAACSEEVRERLKSIILSLCRVGVSCEGTAFTRKSSTPCTSYSK